MPIRSMTGYAQVKGQINDQATFTLSLKSVNHRFLDLHFRMPSESDGLEMKLRRLLKEKLARGHVEITLSVDRNEGDGFRLNRELVSGYIQAFRAASTEFGLMADPDLNVVLRLPGAMGGGNNLNPGELEAAVMAQIEQGLTNLNQMRDEEGRGIDKELREIVLQPDHYPDVSFRSTSVSGKPAGSNKYDLKIIGDLTLHGVTRLINIPTHVTITGNDLRAQGEFSVNRDDFKIKATSAVHGLVRVRNKIKFTFNIVGHLM